MTIDARAALDLFNQKRFDEALPLLQRLVDAGNTDISCILAYASCLERCGEEARAIAILEQVYHAVPSAQFAIHLGSALLRVSRHDLLEKYLPQLLRDHPGNATLLSMQSEFLLASGNYGAGFDLACHRWADALEPSAADALPCSTWNGDLFDGTLLVTTEQGLGDEILVSSMFDDLVKLKQKSLIACDARLLPVFTRSFPTLQFTDRRGDGLAQTAQSADCQKICGLDLGRFFRRRAEDFPARNRWLIPDSEKSRLIRNVLRKQFPGKRMTGIAWRSVRLQFGDAKTIPLVDLTPLLSEPNTVFISLQYGETRTELDDLRATTGFTIQSISDINNTHDIDSLLALIDALDDVVSSSNTTVHLAAALGKSVYTLIPGTRYALWYWGYEGSQTPWYPSMRIYRGPQRKSWHDLAADVAAERKQRIMA